MRVPSKVLFAALSSVAAANASAQVVITEIHYNPNGSETASQEWIEIYNPTSSSIDLSGWSWGDSQDIQYTGPFASGTSLAPGQAAILLFQNPTEFAAMWGTSVKTIPTDTAISLSNMASATNELVVLRDANRNIIDEVNYESGTNGWPPSTNGRSIYLLPNAMGRTNNDIGSNWALATNGTNDAYLARIINPAITNAVDPDTASPGIVSLVPSTVRGDFGGNESPDGSFNSPDGTFDSLDIEGFLLALNNQSSFLTLNPTLSSSLVALGDFGGNESTDGSFNTPDGAFDSLDIEGFLLALNNPAGYAAIQPPGVGGISPIPEPAAVTLLAPMGMLLSRRRR